MEFPAILLASIILCGAIEAAEEDQREGVIFGRVRMREFLKDPNLPPLTYDEAEVWRYLCTIARAEPSAIGITLPDRQSISSSLWLTAMTFVVETQHARRIFAHGRPS